MFDIIFDFLLQPAFLTVGLLVPQAVLISVAAGCVASRRPYARGRSWIRWTLALLTGLTGTLLAICGFFSWTVVSGNEIFQTLAWPAAALVWFAAWFFLTRFRLHAAWAALLVAGSAWVIDTYITAAILFE